jgi:hypothetical protein
MSEVEQGWPAALTDGASARAVGLAAGVLQLVIDRAYPTGKPLEFELRARDSVLALQGKSAGSKRRDDGSYLVRVKLHSLRSEQITLLDALFPR